jgi:Tfp pilus assembly protein FimT
VHRANGKQLGFSLVEMTMVCAIAAILTIAAIPIFQSALQSSDADSAAITLAQSLSYARAIAISTHSPTSVQIDPSANSVMVSPETGEARGPFMLASRIRFMSTAPALDTPEGLGTTVLGVGSNTQVTFLDNGTAVTDETGATLCSGTFFLQQADSDSITTRAVTLLGSTGNARIWKYSSKTDSWD